MFTNTNSGNPVTLDEILKNFSLSARYYVGFIIMILLVYINDYNVSGSYVFTAEKVNYWCVDSRFGNDSCASLSNSTDVCEEWMYDNPYSFVAEFKLACQEWKRTLAGTAQAFGYGIGLLIIGPLSDRFGRKTLLVTTAVTSMVLGVTKSFSVNYWMFIILEFLGSAFGNAYSPAYILAMEMVACEKRVLTNILFSFGLPIALILLPLAAWLFPHWRHLLLVLHTPAVIFLFYIIFLDESPRWLLSKSRKEEAIAILENTAKICKVRLDKKDLDNLTCERNEEVTFKKCIKYTFSSKVLVKRFLMCVLWWNASMFLNVGLTIHSVELPGNKYLNYGYLAIAAFLGKLMTYFVLKSYTRKISLMQSFILSVFFFILQPFLSGNLQWLSRVLFMFAKLLMTINISVLYIFTSELFPTYTRNSMHALCSSLGRIGPMLATQTPLLIVYWNGMPSMTFAIVSLLAGVMTLLAPDSSDEVLPDNVRQAEAFGLPAAGGIDNKAMTDDTLEMDDIELSSELQNGSSSVKTDTKKKP